jgi:hypothetical protein
MEKERNILINTTLKLTINKYLNIFIKLIYKNRFSFF